MSARISCAATVVFSATFTVLFSARAAAAPRRHRGVETVRGRTVAAGELLVRYRHPVPTGAADPDIDVDEQVGANGWRLIHSSSRRVDALLAAFAARSDVAAAEPNYEVSATATPNDLTSSLWAFRNTGQTLDGGVSGLAGADMNVLPAWDATTGSRRIVVATIDSGILATHPDLAGNVWSAPRAFTVTIAGVTVTCAAGTHGFDAIAKTCDPSDLNGHGTHVAGSIGATGNNAYGVVGVNWATSIMAAKFLDANGSGFVSDAVDAIEFVVQAKQAFASDGSADVRVLNNSWASGGYSQALADEIDRANAADMLFVAAAGNTPIDLATRPSYPASYPGANVIAVAATDYDDRLASFSGFGASTVHLAAPGVAIYSTTIAPGDPSSPSFTTLSGTSMATAYVSGAAALVLSHCPYGTRSLRNALLTSATHIPALDGVVESGRRLNVAAAVTSCGGATASASDIVLYASDVPPASIRGGFATAPDATAAGGVKLTTPVDGVTSTASAVAAPPTAFDVTFAAPAGVPYRLWLRMRAAGDSSASDSVWIQFSDALVNGAPADSINTAQALAVNLENCSGCGVSGWGWQDGAWWLARAPLTFASDGSHTLRVQPREDGVQVDQIVLSPTTYLGSSPGQVEGDATIVAKGGGAPGPPGGGPTPFFGSPAAIPGTIRAETFDNGGEGVAYHDDSAGNAGGAFRQTDVDIAGDGAGGYVVGWVSPGEWLKYTVNVSSAGTYTASFAVASVGSGGTFHLEMNGTNVTGSLRVPDTGGWLAMQTVTATVSLNAGTQVARLVMDTAGQYAVGNFGAIVFAAAATPGRLSPYLGTPAAVPGRVDAANFDNGGEGVAYHDESAGNEGGAYRASDVDLAPSSEGGYTIGWIGAGEWVNYTVNVARDGAYVVQLRVASPSGGGALHIGFNGSPGSWTQVAIPATGDWQAWTSVSIPLTLKAGVQQITLLFDTGGYNVSYMTVQ